MAKLSWDKHDYETGLDRGVYFPSNAPAEAWSGLVSVVENPPELRTIVTYREGLKVVNLKSEGSYSATIDAYSYPTSLNRRSTFGFSYRTLTSDGYRLHVVYNALAHFSEHSYKFDETSTFSFDISTTPVAIPGVKPSAHLVIDTETAYSWAVAAFEDVLYGSNASDARLPSPQEIFDIFEVNSLLRVTDNDDGSFTVTGPDDAIQMLDDTTFQIAWPSASYLDTDTYTIRSL